MKGGSDVSRATTVFLAAAMLTALATVGCGQSSDERDARKFETQLKAELYRQAQEYEAQKAQREAELRRQFALGNVARIRAGETDYDLQRTWDLDRSRAAPFRDAISRTEATVTLTVPAQNATAVEATLSPEWADGREAGPYPGRLAQTTPDGVQVWEIEVPAPPARYGDYTVTITARSAKAETKHVQQTVYLPRTAEEEQAARQEQHRRDLEELRRLTQQAVEQLQGGGDGATHTDGR